MILKTFDIPNAMYRFVTQVQCAQEHKETLVAWVKQNSIPCSVIDNYVNHTFYFKNECDRLLFLLSNQHE